jgi:adenine phosphoribosyltransferase
MNAADLRSLIREIPDFPQPGIVFKDITPLLLDPAALDCAVSELAAFARGLEIDLVVAAEARGFILGAALARELSAGFVPRVLVHDDLLATGGTARGVCDLVAGLGAQIAGCAFLIELSFLGGRERLEPYPVHAVLEYAS